jgi:hypothetical protein
MQQKSNKIYAFISSHSTYVLGNDSKHQVKMLINSSDIKKHAHTEGKQSYNVLFVKYETLKCRFGVLLHHGVSKCFCVLFPYWTCLVILCNFSLLNSNEWQSPCFLLEKTM